MGVLVGGSGWGPAVGGGVKLGGTSSSTRSESAGNLVRRLVRRVLGLMGLMGCARDVWALSRQLVVVSMRSG